MPWFHVLVQRILRGMNVVQRGCLFALFFCAFVFRVESQVELCVDESLVDPGAICPTVFDPVCGCNGISYSNACEAQALGGVLQWTEGACAALPCADLAGIDFGLCEMAMGVARIDGSCQFVSGCGAVVGGVNYAPAFFESFESCILACATTCVDAQLLQLGATIFCAEEFDPVCGCDGSTYSNTCEAMYIGGVTSWTAGACGTGDQVPGCTYPWACNYNAAANDDDGTCLFPPMDCPMPMGGGCMYASASNYDPGALFDDGTCLFAASEFCPSDVDGDLSVGVSDVLAVLSQFGQICN